MKTKSIIRGKQEKYLNLISYLMAESDLQIYQVGHKFNNCLGGYVDEAMEQRVFILFLRNKVTEEIEYAMEVSPNKVLYQAEGKYNQLPPENVWEIIKSIVMKKELEFPKKGQLKLIIASLVSIVSVVLILPIL
ncbi:PcfJ domain-containing protein [Bacillus subtilis]|uniref:PcfJ domain-containing protein n=1 Tax=Bacillus subtilis TaxID=1423 RepID=UPI003F7B869F